MSEKEKRLYPRTELLKPITYDVGISMSRLETFDAELLNISNGGACIITERGYGPGRVLKLRIPHEGTDGLVPRLAEVRWSDFFESRFKMGLKFLG
jgi:c-di-GMP-binding flagellar brake protein YcgR